MSPGTICRYCASVTVSAAPESSSMCRIRFRGYVGSTGTKAAPVLATAHTARIDGSDRGRASATTVSGPAPSPISIRANRFDCSSSWW
ncbi:hypothetical protein GCM10023094_48810 [Rhodococcus olei]|uniref:Uncharacterized protein n=1 Tax=Rhodococcus olei TaxID=2161675 RepID=A0ABP8PL82_9NOCA